MPTSRISTPPTILIVFRYSRRRPPRKLADAPSETNTREKPMIKANEFNTTRQRTRERACALRISSSETPETKERYEGISGRTQGERNEKTPAAKATKMFTSVIACRR